VKAIVTGAAGFIGAAVTERLLRDGHDVLGVDAFLPDLYPAEVKRARARGMLGHPSLDLLDLDLRTCSLAPWLDGVDVVVHLAALPGLVGSWDDFRTYQDCNVLATQRLLADLAAEPGPRLVLASTSSVYGAEVDGDEDAPLVPVSPYGVTKLAAERLVDAYRASHGLEAAVLRYFSVYGPGQRPDMAYAVVCERLLAGLPVPIVGTGRQSRCNTHIDDVVEATVRAAEARIDGAVLNVCGQEEIALLDAVAVLADELGIEPVIEGLPARAGDQLRTRGDSDRAHALLGWSPRVALEDGLRGQARAALERQVPLESVVGAA